MFIFSDDNNITALFKEYAFGKLNASPNNSDSWNFATAGTEQQSVTQFIRSETKADNALAVCLLVRETDECIVVPYDPEKSLDEQIQRIVSKLNLKAKFKNALGKVVDQGRTIMRALDNSTVMNIIDNWKITEMLGEYYEDHGMSALICLACALGVLLGVTILAIMGCVERCKNKASVCPASENSVQ